MHSDPRYPHLSPQGQQELLVYLKWLDEYQLVDNEKNFIFFCISRAELKDGRQLFNIWKEMFKEDNNEQSVLTSLRFFLAPSETSFRQSYLAGWFDFLVKVYGFSNKEKILDSKFEKPTFCKIS